MGPLDDRLVLVQDRRLSSLHQAASLQRISFEKVEIALAQQKYALAGEEQRAWSRKQQSTCLGRVQPVHKDRRLLQQNVIARFKQPSVSAAPWGRGQR